jgi:hypothetical protein
MKPAGRNRGWRTLVVSFLVVVGALAVTLSACGSPDTTGGQAPEQAAAGQAPVSVYTDSPSPTDLTSASTPGTATSTGDANAADPYEQEDLKQVRIVHVGLAAEGEYVIVQFAAPPRLAKTWRSGIVSVTDERTGTVYDDVPIAPVLGELFGRPVSDGQIGYVMFDNLPQLQNGAQVTVVLGEFKQEHVVLQ